MMGKLTWDFGIDASRGPLVGPLMGQRAGGAASGSSIDELRSRVDRLSMICCAMWSVIQAHTNVTDEELIRLISELDLSDGLEDGRISVEQVGACGGCGRPVAMRHLKCIYCGQPRSGSNPFESVL